jgi:quinol monooxygenase YgiN
MRPFFRSTRPRSTFAGIFVAAALAQSAHAQGSAVYVATYVEVMPGAATNGIALLQAYRDASRKENGNLRFDALQEIARPNRFVILEAWEAKAALDGHGAAVAAQQFRSRLKAIESAPYDERINNPLFAGQARDESLTGAVYVVTHVDVVPSGKDACIAALHDMSLDTPKDTGNITYEALQQSNRANHFTVIEAWTDQNAVDAHAAAAHTRAFREKLAPIAGAIYDERLYKALD